MENTWTAWSITRYTVFVRKYLGGRRKEVYTRLVASCNVRGEVVERSQKEILPVDKKERKMNPFEFSFLKSSKRERERDFLLHFSSN